MAQPEQKMKIYTVINDETDYREDFHSLTAAKQAMREHNAQGFITNTRQQKKNY